MSGNQPNAPDAAREFAELMNRAEQCLAAGQYAAAEQCCMRAAACAPDSPRPYVGLGMIALHTDQLDVAQQKFSRALELEPQTPDALAGLAVVAQRRQDYPHAFELFLKCLEIDGDNLVALLGLFQASMQMRSFAKIIHYLEVYLARHPRDSAVLFCLGTLYAREGELARARAVLEQVVQIEPGNSEARSMLKEVAATIDKGGRP